MMVHRCTPSFVESHPKVLYEMYRVHKTSFPIYNTFKGSSRVLGGRTFSYQTFLSFIKSKKSFTRKSFPFFLRSSEGFAFFQRNLFCALRNSKTFHLRRFSPPPEYTGRTFKNSVNLKTRFLHSVHLEEHF